MTQILNMYIVSHSTNFPTFHNLVPTLLSAHSFSCHSIHDFFPLPLNPSPDHRPTGRHPITHTLTLHVPKPPKPSSPHHSNHLLYIQPSAQLYARNSIPQSYSAHSLDHHSLGFILSTFLSSSIFTAHVSLPYTLHTGTVFLL